MNSLTNIVKWAAACMSLVTAAAVALEIHLVTDLERLTQQIETGLHTPATDAQALRSLAASALDGAQGMTWVASAAMLIAIGACAISALVLFAVYRELKKRESPPPESE